MQDPPEHEATPFGYEHLLPTEPQLLTSEARLSAVQTLLTL